MLEHLDAQAARIAELETDLSAIEILKNKDET